MRILLIEDDRATAQSVELMLKSERFYLYTTDLGEDGIELGKLYDYDIVLLEGTSNNDDFFVGLIAGATGR